MSITTDTQTDDTDDEQTYEQRDGESFREAQRRVMMDLRVC